jgi:hypothetical protein
LRDIRGGVGYVALVLVQLLLAAAVAAAPWLIVPVMVGCLLVVLLVARGALLVLALPACFAANRLTVVGVELSVADAALAAMVIAALPFVDRSNRAVRGVLTVGAIYLVATGVNVFAVTTRTAVVEWVHRWFLVVGAILIGAAIAQCGRTIAALRALLAVAIVFALASIHEAIGTGFRPAYTFGFHKNFVGPLLAMTVLTVLAGRPMFRIPAWSSSIAQLIMVLGLLATQSRASMLGLVAGVAVLFVRSGRLRWRSVLLAPVLAGLSFFVYVSIRTNLTGLNDTRFSPIRTRIAQYETAWGHFVDHPVFGVGIRWFKTPGTIDAEPHSALFVTLSETGAWGLVAVAGLFIGTWMVLRRAAAPLADAAIAVLAFRLVEGQFAIFWLAGTMTLPWLLVGLAAGVSRSGSLGEPERSGEANPVTLSHAPT